MISSGGVPRIDIIKEMAYYEDIPIEIKRSQNRKAWDIKYGEHSERTGRALNKVVHLFPSSIETRVTTFALATGIYKEGRNCRQYN